MLTSSSMSKLSRDCGFTLVLLRFLKFEIGVDKTSSSLWPVVVLLEATGFDLVRFTNTGASSAMAGVQGELQLSPGPFMPWRQALARLHLDGQYDTYMCRF